MADIVFDVTSTEDGGLVARCRSEDIVVEAEDFDELASKVPAVVEDHFLGRIVPKPIRLNFK